MPLVYTICTEMYGNGVMIGMVHYMTEKQHTRKGQQRENVVFCGADLSTPMYRLLIHPSETTSRLPIGTSTMGSVWRGLSNYGHLLQHGGVENSNYDGLKFIFTRVKKDNDLNVQNFRVLINHSPKFVYLLLGSEVPRVGIEPTTS